MGGLPPPVCWTSGPEPCEPAAAAGAVQTGAEHVPPLRCACEAGIPSQRYGHSQRVKVREGGEREKERDGMCAHGEIR